MQPTYSPRLSIKEKFAACIFTARILIVTDPDTQSYYQGAEESGLLRDSGALYDRDRGCMQMLFFLVSAMLEKEGTFTNTERRVQRVRKAVTIPGEMQDLDTDIIIDLMNRMGYPQPHLTSAQIMDEVASVTPSFGGISHARLDSEEVGRKRASVAMSDKRPSGYSDYACW